MVVLSSAPPPSSPIRYSADDVKRMVASYEGDDAAIEQQSHEAVRRPVPDVISADEILDFGRQCHKGVTRAALYGAYLTGARASELTQMRARDIRHNVSNHQNITTITLNTLKNRITPIRTIPVISPGKCCEDEMLAELRGVITKNGMVPEQRLFPFTRQYLHQLLHDLSCSLGVTVYEPGKKTPTRQVIDDFRFFPHYLRHCRLTHMVTVYNLSPMALMKFAGWSSLAPADRYVRLSYHDMAAQMMRA